MNRRNLVLVLVGVFASLAATNAFSYTAAYIASSPTMDGVLSSGEWGSASAYEVTMDRRDGDAVHNANLYFQHDGTSLFIGVDSQWNSGWDVYWDIFIDGDHNGSLNGSLTPPHIDISICQPSPGGYPGYKAYYVLTSPTSLTNVGFGSGAASASSGSANVTYEYRIPLADLDVMPGDSVGFHSAHGYDGVTEHLYELRGDSRSTPQNWATLDLAPVPEPSTLLLLCTGAVGFGLCGRRRRRR